MKRSQLRLRQWVGSGVLALAAASAQAGLFDDDEARKAILDLRARVSQAEEALQRTQAELAASNAQLGERMGGQLTEQVTALRRTLLDLSARIDAMQTEIARLRGTGEQLQRDVSELQRAQKDAHQSFDDRLRKLEPQRVTLDGREFAADPAERRAYDDAVAVMRSGDFGGAVAALSTFVARYPRSGFADTARFWLGNAQYGKRDHKAAIATFRALVSDAPDHPKAPEALLALANSQAEMKETKAARKTIEELIKKYPQSEAAAAGKDRLPSLK